MPSVQQERITVMSSTCCAMFGYQSDTQMPLSPYCLKVRRLGINVLFDVPFVSYGETVVYRGIGANAAAKAVSTSATSAPIK